MPSRSHNPERSAWKGRSYKKGGAHIRTLKNALENALTCPICKPGPCQGHMVVPPETVSTLPPPEDDAPDVECPSCSVCGGETKPLGTLGRREHFRCTACGMDCSVTSPLEWWELVQIALVESTGFPEEAAYFRDHPDEWRAFRDKLRNATKGPTP